MTETKPAELSRVTKRFGETVALDAVDLVVRPGEVLALLGANGAGKTTAVRLLLGLARPNEGTARVFGADPRQTATRRRIGAMQQVGKVPETLTVREHVALFSTYYPSPRPIDETLRVAGLVGIERRRFGELSGGQQQRVRFALAICGQPDLLVLDEPTVGLDVESRRGLWDQIRRLSGEGVSVLLTTHYLGEADALSHRIVVLDRGRVIAEGTPDAIKQRAALRRVRCVTTIAAADIEAWPGVRSVERDRGALVIHAIDADAVARALFTRDPHVTQLEIGNVALEDAFLALTAHEDAQEVA